MDLGIAGRVAIVMGATRGIGRAVAEELARAGCRVVASARSTEGVAITVDALRRAGTEAVGAPLDLSRVESYPELVRIAEDAFGPPQIAVFNMETPASGAFDELSDADFAHSHHIVVTCFANLVRAVVPGMKAARWGRIVTVGSQSVKQPVRATANFAYTLANTHRVAAVGLSKTLAAELAPFGVTVNTIATGTIGTDAAHDWLAARGREVGLEPQAMLDAVRASIPMGRLGRPDEMAALCAFLCSDRAGYTTGETILCDGGAVQAML